MAQRSLRRRAREGCETRRHMLSDDEGPADVEGAAPPAMALKRRRATGRGADQDEPIACRAGSCFLCRRVSSAAAMLVPPMRYRIRSRRRRLAFSLAPAAERTLATNCACKRRPSAEAENGAFGFRHEIHRSQTQRLQCRFCAFAR